MRGHALQRECQFRRIFGGKDRTLQAMTIETPQDRHFLRGRARRTLHPLAVGHLQGEKVRGGLHKAQVKVRGAAGFDRCRGRLERVPDRTYRDVISSGGEPVLRETVLPLRVGADRNHDGRARALGADHDTFHVSFLRGGYGTGQRRRAAVLSHRRMAPCGEQSHEGRARHCAEGQSRKNISKSRGGRHQTLRGGTVADFIPIRRSCWPDQEYRDTWDGARGLNGASRPFGHSPLAGRELPPT